MATKKKASGLAGALRSKRGRWCWFKHPDTGAIIEGPYKGRRKVEQMTGLKRTATGFDSQVTIWTLPKSVEIHFGQPPIAEPLQPPTREQRGDL